MLGDTRLVVEAMVASLRSAGYQPGRPWADPARAAVPAASPGDHVVSVISGATDDRRGALLSANTSRPDHPDLLEIYVTNVYDFDAIQEAFEAAGTPKVGQLKIAHGGPAGLLGDSR